MHRRSCAALVATTLVRPRAWLAGLAVLVNRAADSPPMVTASDMTRLTSLAAFASLPAPELEWLAAHGTVRRLQPGDVLYSANHEGEDLRAVFVVLSGRFSVRVNQDGVEREVREVNAGQISGTLPYSRHPHILPLFDSGTADGFLSSSCPSSRERPATCIPTGNDS